MKEKIMNIVGRAPTEPAVKRILPLMKLCQRSLNKGSRGTDQRGDPHPKYRTGTAAGNSRNNTYKISHTDSRCCRNNQRLKAGQLSLGKVALHLCIRLFNEHGYHLPKHTNRQKLRAKGIINSGRNE